MSTKSTIASGAGFDLDTDLLDDEFVNLALEGVPFEASANRLIASIPIAIWEYLRHFAAVDLSWAVHDDALVCDACGDKLIGERASDTRRTEIVYAAHCGGGARFHIADTTQRLIPC